MAMSTEWNDVSDAVLEEDAITELCKVLNPIKAKWDCFATQLGILPDTTDDIGRKNHYDSTLCLKGVLNTWLKGGYNIQKHGHQSWRRVCEATASSAGGENKRLAQEIAAQHRAEQTDTALKELSPGSEEIDSADEKPKFPMELIEVIQRECKTLKPLEDQHQLQVAVKDFAATEVKVVIQSCNEAEYAAALEAIKCPPLPMFDKPVRYPNDENFTIVVGTFAGQNAAIVRTEKGTKCRDDLTAILHFFPNATMVLGLGVCMGIKHKLGDVLIGEKIQLEENPKVRRGKLQLVGPCNEAKQKMRNIFCGTIDWNNFECTADVPEGSDVKTRISKAFSGCILSSPNLLDDASIKHGLESETQSLIGAEMEGWVLFKYIEEDFPKIKSLIIKGICDYGDGTKSKDWQLTAAKAAMDYARFKLENAFM